MNGYEGTNCQTNIDDCALNNVICQNGGTCQVKQCELTHYCLFVEEILIVHLLEMCVKQVML